MTFAFVFPGQGSQSVGMLTAFAGNRVVTDTFAEASDALGFDLAQLVATGPAEDLNLTTNTQPVMLTAGVSYFRAWRAAGGAMPVLMAGHSLGEYAALVAANVIPLAAAVRLVRLRAGAMQEAVPVGTGGMAAILGLDAAMVEAACVDAAQGEVVEPANFNDPLQTVIAGHLGAIARACDLAKQRGAKRAVPLAVSAPFHSSLMRPAADRLATYLADVPFGAPAVPVINNVDVAVNQDARGIKDALARQACHAVRWVETVQAMRLRGITHVVECGPGRVLAGMVRRIDRDLTSGAIADPLSLQQTLELLQ